MRLLLAVFCLGCFAFGGFVLSGCSERIETPAMAADSTLVFPAKHPGDIECRITFASKSKPSKKTGKRRGVSRDFEIEEKARVYAFVDIRNQFARGDDELSFHLVWLKPNDKTAFKKRIEYTPSDADTTLKSSFSIYPGKRTPGTYKLRVYLFRELIAEKSFRLHGETGVEEEDDFEGVTM
jgi:hypothetical protein